MKRPPLCEHGRRAQKLPAAKRKEQVAKQMGRTGLFFRNFFVRKKFHLPRGDLRFAKEATPVTVAVDTLTPTTTRSCEPPWLGTAVAIDRHG